MYRNYEHILLQSMSNKDILQTIFIEGKLTVGGFIDLICYENEYWHVYPEKNILKMVVVDASADYRRQFIKKKKFNTGWMNQQTIINRLKYFILIIVSIIKGIANSCSTEFYYTGDSCSGYIIN